MLQWLAQRCLPLKYAKWGRATDLYNSQHRWAEFPRIDNRDETMLFGKHLQTLFVQPHIPRRRCNPNNRRIRSKHRIK